MKYNSLRVLNERDFMTDDAITEVANMINAKGVNRGQKRRLEKSLSKMETILAHTQSHVDRSAYKEYQKRVEKNYLHFFAVLGLTMIEDYRWQETEENEHGPISSLFERVDKKINKYSGYETEDILKILEDKTGIILQSKE